MNKILVLGGAAWNRMIYVDRLPANHSASVFGARYSDGIGSTGVGKAFAAKALGFDPTLHCVLGDDHHGSLIEEAILSRGIHLVVDIETGGVSPHHLNIMDSAGQRISFLLENGSASPRINVDRLAPMITDADIIFASITTSTQPLLKLLDQSSALVHVDLHDWDGENPYHAPFAAVGNIIQVSDEGLSDPAQTCDQLLKSGAREVVLTKGAQGASVFAGAAMTEIAPVLVEAVDTNGAGDAFGVAYTLARHQGLSIADAGAKAARVAAQVVASADIVPTELS